MSTRFHALHHLITDVQVEGDQVRLEINGNDAGSLKVHPPIIPIFLLSLSEVIPIATRTSAGIRWDSKWALRHPEQQLVSEYGDLTTVENLLRGR